MEIKIKKTYFGKIIAITSLIISISIASKWYNYNFINTQKESIFNMPYLSWIIFSVIIIYFLSNLYQLFQLFFLKNKKPEIALIINEDEITTPHSEMKLLGTIFWKDIFAVGTKNTLTDTFLLVKVENPTDYIQRANSNFKLKQQLRSNLLKYGTPIIISTKGLEKSAHEIKKNHKNRATKIQNILTKNPYFKSKDFLSNHSDVLKKQQSMKKTINKTKNNTSKWFNL